MKTKDKMLFMFFSYVDKIGRLIENGWKKYDEMKNKEEELKVEAERLTQHQD